MRIALAGLLLLLSVPGAAVAQGQDIGKAEYAARRDSLAARIDSGVVVAFGAPEPTGIHKEPQLAAFRYLTGFLEPNAAFLLVKRGGTVQSFLFTATRDPRRALYDGFPPDSAAVAQQTGLQVRSLPAFGPAVDSLVQAGLPVYDLRDFASSDAEDADSLTRGSRFIADLKSRHPGLRVEDAHAIVDQLRARKSPA
ncbi:MAG TPA: aminopeptidase P N-terminal domain-containing protein, partial [Gemmatimonadales bacterium]|nr:aminopeptidase P N-terminal domain-containing protein [Gemmatimonadales bacterium]